MSPEQLITLQKLSRLFEDGVAGPDQIKQLAELLAKVNQLIDPIDEVNAEQFSGRTPFN
ncbi:hypothetical protein Q4493_03845 [Colwellia sp. 1_MG-2023]|uniref:hypothetical protein n=1 Tax=Colwellia sp. 1_MG-2023 TaxID=3062649 RepID=UPI0026E31A59|nr:hypothetical protein [Colwellia sp. 1_MG-2023]MDO6444904.1 hypothetical protein [Colwellia sp. 1_MG-2023]